MNIEGVEIGQGQPCRFVAEIGNAHNGDLRRALKLITAAKNAGCDLVKFQTYLPSELIQLRGNGSAPEPWGSQGWTMEALYQKAATPFAWLPDLFAYARDIDIVPFSSVFGRESLDALEAVNCPAYKLSKFERNDSGLGRLVAAKVKPMIVSTPDYFQVSDYRRLLETLYCPGSYPCAVGDVKLPRWFGEPDGHLGLSSHCLDPALPIAAVSRGCKLIEMHFMLHDEPSELESNVSLTEQQFAAMISDVRATEAMLS